MSYNMNTNNTNNSGINRRETDAQVLRLISISTVAFIVIGAIVYGIYGGF